MSRVIKELSAEDLAYWRDAMPKLGEISAGIGEDLLAHISYVEAQLDQAEAEHECRATDLNRVLAENERLREALRISYPATPVDCLLSTLSELWDAPWDVFHDKLAVISHVHGAADDARQVLAQIEKP